MEDEADNDWDRTKMVDNRRGGGVKTVTIGVGTHFTYDWAHHADAFAAASAGLPAFRAWLAAGPFNASVKAHWAGLSDTVVNDARLAVLEPA